MLYISLFYVDFLQVLTFQCSSAEYMAAVPGRLLCVIFVCLFREEVVSNILLL